MGKPWSEQSQPGSPRPRVRFDAIGEAWGLFKDQAGTWLLAGLIVVLGNWAVTAAVFGFVGEKAPPAGGGFRVQVPPSGQFLDVVLSTLVNGFFLGGMFRMACLQVRGQRVSVGDLLGVVGVLRELAVGAVFYGLILFGSALAFVLPAFVAAGVLMFTFPLIVDGRLSGLDALRVSWDRLKRDWLSATVFHLLLNLLAGAGACLFCVGLLFTMPLYCLSIAVLYRDFFLSKGVDPYDKPPLIDPDF